MSVSPAYKTGCALFLCQKREELEQKWRKATKCRQSRTYFIGAMRVISLSFLFAGINIVGAGFLSATERARESFVTSIMRGFVCIIGCSMLFAAVFGINGVWLSFPASELLTAIVMAVVLVRDNRRL